jgi:signal transduction histidine kinase/DNA-binding response OmpR family regulator
LVELLAPGETYPSAAVLIVDDDPGTLLALEAVLTPLGHRIVRARSGQEALELAEQNDFALALIDVTMRGMDGFETAARMRRLERARATAVVFVTGYADSTSHIERGYAAGAIDYVTKPLDPDRLRLKAASFILLYQRGEALKRRALEVAVAESARRAAEEHSRQQRLLADASRLLADASVDPERALANLAAAAVPAFADWCRIDLLDDSGVGKQVAGAFHPGPGEAPAPGRTSLQDLRASWTRARAVMASGQADLVPDLSAVAVAGAGGNGAGPLRETEQRSLAEAGVRGFLVVPLVAREKVLGALTLLRAGASPPFRDSDQHLARELASRAALALENARLYQLAERAAAAREELLAVVSHDLQNPLMAMLMKANLLQRLLPAEQADGRPGQTLEGILRAGKQMTGLLKLLMDATAIEKGSLTVELRPCDPADLAREAIELLTPVAADRTIRLTLEPVGGLPPVQADRDRVFQVLSNLLGNAIKYTGPGGQVTLRMSRADDRVGFSVADTGKGIEPEHLPRLFERYWQVDRRREGLGLGLYISKGIVDAHGGSITVASTPGQGSTFAFTLPVAKPQPAASPTLRDSAALS